MPCHLLIWHATTLWDSLKYRIGADQCLYPGECSFGFDP
jgi:hypothetical protein